MATVEELLSVIQKYGGKYSLSEKAKALGGDRVGALLWEARAQGVETMEYANNVLHLHPGAPELWDAEAFCALITELQKHHPDGHFQNSATGWCSNYFGGTSGIREMLAEKKEDASFAEAMTARWRSLPPFWGQAIAFYLVLNGMMSQAELTDDELIALATVRLEHSGLYPYEKWTAAVDAQRWGRALARAAAAPDLFSLDKNERLLELLPYATPDELLIALGRTSYYITATFLNELEKGAGGAEGADDDWAEQALAALPDDNRQQPRRALLALTLRRCAAGSRTPPTFVDAAVAVALSNEEISSYSGLYPLLLILPPERLGPLLLAAKPLHWDLLFACPTELVAAGIVERIAGSVNLRGVPHKMQTWEPGTPPKSWALYEMRSLVLPHAVAALEAAPKSPNRQYLLQALVIAGMPAEVGRLSAYLTDADKAVRELAIAGVTAAGGDATAALLKPLLNAGKKEPRLAAAEAMAGMEPHPAIYEMAQARLQKERVKAVKGLLESVRPPADEAAGALAAALLASQGAAWADHTGDPQALMAAFWSAYIALYKDKRPDLGDRTLFQSWRAALAVMEDTPDALEHGLKVLDSHQYGAHAVLDALDAHLGDALLPALEARLPRKWPARPAEMGRKGGGCRSAAVVGWLAQQPLERAGPAVLTALASPDVDTRSAATTHLTAQGAAALPTLSAGMHHARAPVRAACVAILDGLRLPESLPALEAALESHPDDKALKTLIAAMRITELSIDAFPEAAAGDAALDKALAGLPQPAWGWRVAAEALPKLSWASGAPLSADTQSWFLSTLGQETLENWETKLNAVRGRLDDDACQAALTALLAEVREHIPYFAQKASESIQSRWMRVNCYKGRYAFACGLLGDDAVMDDMARQLEFLVGDKHGSWGRDAMNALARRGTPAAIRGLEWASRRAGSGTIKRRSGDMLVTMTGWRGISLGELLDEALSEMGFDLEGKQSFDYGGRVLTLQLTAENTLTISDETGKTLRSLPKARKGDDEAAVKIAKKTISTLKKSLRSTHTGQKKRLESYLASQRVWRPGVWRARFLEHPLMRAYSRTLIWEGLDASGASTGAFVDTESGDLMDAELNEVALPTGGVRLLHPLNADAEALAAWAEVLDDNEIIPFFDQLGRRLFRDGDYPETDALLFMKLPTPMAGPFMGSSERCGYKPGPREDGGNIYRTVKQLGRYTLTLHHDGYWPQGKDWEFELRSVGVTLDDAKLDWRSLPPVLRSEIVLDLHRVTGA